MREDQTPKGKPKAVPRETNPQGNDRTPRPGMKGKPQDRPESEYQRPDPERKSGEGRRPEVRP